jgi:hypothetical protein
VEREMDAELRFHMETYAEDLVRKGLLREDALRRARLEFGGMEQTQEECRDARGTNVIDTDLRIGLRMLRKSPGFTVLAALCLALGIGVNTSVFALLDFTMLRPLPVPEPNRMTLLSRAGNPRFSYPDYLAYRDRGQTFAALAASFPTESSLDANEQSHLVSAEAVSANYFETMGIAPFIGRWFMDESEPVAVLSYSAWRNLFQWRPEHYWQKRAVRNAVVHGDWNCLAYLHGYQRSDPDGGLGALAHVGQTISRAGRASPRPRGPVARRNGARTSGRARHPLGSRGKP